MPHLKTRLLGATALCLLPLAASAQAEASFWDLLKPEYIAQRILQTGIMALRTQVDLKYGDMAVDIANGQVALNDVQIWPAPPWDEDGACQVTIDRLVLRAAPLNRPDLIRLKMQGWGVTAGDVCLPPEPRGAMGMAGLSEIAVPQVTLDLEYDIAQAEADVHVYTQLDGLAALDVTADFSYLWINGREDMEEPEPVAYLRNATLTVENLGLFEAAKGQLPPPFTDPAQAGGIVQGMLSGAISDMNRTAARRKGIEDLPTDGAEAAPEGDPGALTDAQTNFVDSVTTALPAFLENPGKLVLETGFDRQNDVRLNLKDYEGDPGQIFADLQPRLALTSASARAALSAALVEQALGDQAASLGDSERESVGLALLSGTGAPRDVETGIALLSPLAEAGNGKAALALSGALEQRDPPQAYRWALVAGADSQIGAAARLDRLERVLPFADVLTLQSDVVGEVSHPLGALQRVTLMRDQAMARLSGIGEARSYSIATLWALMGAATGDAASADILTQIDERVARADDAGKEAWRAIEKAASGLAMQAWLGQDLPARFGAD